MAATAGECAGASVTIEDSDLGRWTAARWAPPRTSPLFNLIERIWYFDGALANAKERVFPDGRSELIVMLDEPHRDGDTALPGRFRSCALMAFARDLRP